MRKAGFLKLDAFSQALFDGMPDLIRIIDAQGTVLYSNEAGKEKPTDRNTEKCIKIPGSETDCESCIAAKCIKNNRSYKNISIIDGRTYSSIAKPIKQKKNTYALEIFRDITPEKTYENIPSASGDRMTKDLEIARSLQLSILRHNLPEMEGYHFYAEFLPCEALGGDMYDCFIARDGRIIMYVADVSGHGVMPAMLTVYLRQEMFAQCKKPNITPAQVLRNIQDSFEELSVEESIYITIFILALDPVNGEYSCANAGHSVPPFIAGSETIRDLFLPGTPVCRWTGSHEHEEMTGVLNKGERLFLYTDGLDGIHSGTSSDEDLKRILMNSSLRGKELLDLIKKEFTQTKADDVTMVLCERE